MAEGMHETRRMSGADPHWPRAEGVRKPCGEEMPEIMQKVINQLIQLQELTVVRAQREASTTGKPLKQLDESIQSLLSSLPPETANQFNRLRAKGILATVPVANNFCSACGMSLPKSLVQSVRVAESLHACPSCARILYYPEHALRGIGKRQPRNATPKVGVARFSAPELMVSSMESQTKEEALSELCERLELEGFIDDAARILDQALAREAIASTSVDNGLAFPHVRGVEGGGLTISLGISKKGIRFEENSRRLTRIIFFMVIPTAASAFYLKLLSGLTQSFREQENREKLMGCETSAELWKMLTRITKSTVK